MNGVQLYCGDVIKVLADKSDESYVACFCDPPYGLSALKSNQNVSQRIYDALLKIGFPNLYERNAKVSQSGNFSGVVDSSSSLRIENGTIREESGISVPKGSIDFQDGMIVNQEVRDGDKTPSFGVSDGVLPVKADAQGGQFLGDFVLKLGNMPTLNVTGDMLDSCLAEAFFGGFAVPIFAPLASGLPSLDGGGSSITFGDHNIRFSNNTFCQSQTAPYIVTLPRAVNTLMLRFDLRGRPIELFATYRADYLATLGEVGGTELVRAFPTASGLASISQPSRVRFIVPMADGAFSLYWFHLWCPLESITKSIIPRGGFMGKSWDSTLPNPQAWREIYRVLKPGAILLSFGGTRTWHRLAVAIEDAGFELFDTAMWLHGQGFPKSASIGKMIDKAVGAERKIVGKDKYANRGAGIHGSTFHYEKSDAKKRGNITAPATDAAKIWEGYGTSLKPAWEPILMARKPRRDTYAQTAIEHCSGALNIDGCRVGTEEVTINTWDDGMKPFGDGAGHPFTGRQQSGRWPANLILDEEAAEMLDEQSGKLKSGYMRSGQRRKASRGLGGYHDNFPDEATAKGTYGDSGGASRFFYCAKSSRKEREAGLQGHLPCLTCGEINTTHHTNKAGRKIACRRCDHPTVKPIALCEYIARLIRPPEACLDEVRLLVPFCGVGSEIVGSLKAGWRNITGIDIVQEYIDIAELRIEEAKC